MATQYIQSAYEVLAKDIQSLGVDTVFGLISDDTALFVTALDMIGVQFHGARHENTAITMAEGYASTSGRLGIAVVGRGPATANGLHAAVYANRTGSPVLIIYGDAPVPGGHINTLGPDYKEFNSTMVLSPLVYRYSAPQVRGVPEQHWLMRLPQPNLATLQHCCCQRAYSSRNLILAMMLKNRL